MPVLDPADQALPDLVLHGRRHLVEGRPVPRVSDRRPHALRVIEELEPHRGSELLRPVVSGVDCPAPPGGVPVLSRGDESGHPLFAGDVDVGAERHVLEPRVGGREIRDPTLAGVVAVLLGPDDPVQSGREILEGGDGELAGVGGGGVVVVGDIPPLDDPGRHREPVGEAIAQQPAGVGDRDREREEQGPREVQVVGRLDHLVAEERHELARLERQPATERDLIGEIGLLEVDLLGLPGRVLEVPEDADRVILLRVLAAGDDDAEAERILVGRVLLHAELGHVEAKAFVAVVEAQRIDLPGAREPAAVGAGVAQIPDVAGFDVPEESDFFEKRLRLLLGLRLRLLRGRGARGERHQRRHDHCSPNTRHGRLLSGRVTPHDHRARPSGSGRRLRARKQTPCHLRCCRSSPCRRSATPRRPRGGRARQPRP